MWLSVGQPDFQPLLLTLLLFYPLTAVLTRFFCFRYILSIQTSREVEDYLCELLDSKVSRNRRFIDQLLKKWQPPDRQINVPDGIQVSSNEISHNLWLWLKGYRVLALTQIPHSITGSNTNKFPDQKRGNQLPGNIESRYVDRWVIKYDEILPCF